jgi:hypothetical protein
MRDIAENGGHIFADRCGGRAGAVYAAAPEIGDKSRRVGRPSAWRPVSLKAVVWASPVFVVGCPRSGTTLVQTILDSHPRLSVLYEANFLVDIPLGLQSGQANAPDALTLAKAHPNFRADSFDVRKAHLACTELGITDATGAMRALAGSRAVTQGKRRWGDKTPKALLHLAELATLYPDAQFIHVIRDGRDAATSQTRSDRTLIQNALLWRTGLRIGRRVGSRLGTDRYLEVRLEDLLSLPEKHIRRMCTFLEEDFDLSLLHFHTTARERIPMSDLPLHPRLGQLPRPLPPRPDGAAAGLVQRAADALIDRELVEFGYEQAPSCQRGRIVYVSIGYTLFLVALRRTWRELLRHFSRSIGARRAARRVTRQSADEKLEGGTLSL